MQDDGGSAEHGLVLRRMGLQDLPFAVEAHLQHFPDGFFARLGRRFLTRYYRTYLDGPLACAVVAEDVGGPVGYLAGVLDPPRHRKLLLQHHGPALATAAIAGMIRRPLVALTFARTRVRRYFMALKRARSMTAEGSAQSPGSAVLAHVVVTEPQRCQGIGSHLVEEFLSQARSAGCTRACLVTMAGSAGAGGFYERRGWRLAPHTSGQADGRPLLQYEIPLDVTADGNESHPSTPAGPGGRDACA